MSWALSRFCIMTKRNAAHYSTIILSPCQPHYSSAIHTAETSPTPKQRFVNAAAANGDTNKSSHIRCQKIHRGESSCEIVVRHGASRASPIRPSWRCSPNPAPQQLRIITVSRGRLDTSPQGMYFFLISCEGIDEPTAAVVVEAGKWFPKTIRSPFLILVTKMPRKWKTIKSLTDKL